MSLNSRDIEQIRIEPSRVPRGIRVVVWVLGQFARIPAIRNYFANTKGGRSGRIYACWRSKKYAEAARVALDGLDYYRHRRSRFSAMLDHHSWWTLMWDGAQSAKMVDADESREKFVASALDGLLPLEGFLVAQSFLEFARWRYQAERYDDAVRLAELAANADPSWAEPDFLLGWHALLRGHPDAEARLMRAVEKDHRVLFRIANNELCKRRPELIRHLTEKYKVELIRDIS